MIDYYVASQIGKMSYDQSKIVKGAWDNDGYLNMTAEEIGVVCVETGVPIAKSKVCTDAGSSCAGNTQCEEVFKKYASALKNGYTKTFEDFKKESKQLGYVSTGLGIVAGLFGDPSVTPNVDEKTQRENKIKWGIGITVGLAIVTTGIILYVKSRKK